MTPRFGISAIRPAPGLLAPLLAPLVALSLLASPAPGQARAAEETAQGAPAAPGSLAPARSATLVLAFDEMAPWKTEDKNGYGGAYTEIVRELARRVDVTLEIRSCPLKRCLFMLEQGDADLIIGSRATPERQRYLHYLRTPYRDRSSDRVFYVRRQQGPAIREYADLLPLRIGVKLGATYFDRFDNDAALTKDAAKDMDINFRKLAMGRLDAVLIPEDQGEAQLSRLHLRDQLDKAPFRVADGSERAIGLSRKSPFMARIEEFERAMRDISRDGTLAALYKKYYYDAYQVAPAAVAIK